VVEEPAQRFGAAEAIFAAIGRRAISGKREGEKLETIACDIAERIRRNYDYQSCFSRSSVGSSSSATPPAQARHVR
jgi:hypothetical protein